jgi:alpha-mannosidase
MARKIFHLIGNAHLDPVWLWDWAEGLNEGIITCQAIADLMDENADLTFMRGEAAIYEHIENNDPRLFSRIQQFVEQGRWDVVGGTYIQPDENLPSTEAMVRQYARGQQYFKSRFGKRVRVAWSADCFGHSGGMPEIMAGAGIEGFAFWRPEDCAFPGAFWWYGPGGSRILCYHLPTGWYGAERGELPRRLDAMLEFSSHSPVQNVGIFYGLGNHGGGPSKEQLKDIARWKAEHPDIDIAYSGLHQLIDSLFAEAKAAGDDIFPSFAGELQYCLRGCYSSVAKLKFAYKALESRVCRAERATVLAEYATTNTLKGQPKLADAWDAVLFNQFHDILPGSSIERAFDQQIEWIGGGAHRARAVELTSINKLAGLIDTTVRHPAPGYPSGTPILVWNTHPYPVRAPVELEACLDYRPNPAYKDRWSEVPFELIAPDGSVASCQRIRIDALAMDNPPWRVRVVAVTALPAFGWAVYELAYREGASPTTTPASGFASSPDASSIESDQYGVSAKVGGAGISISKHGKSIFSGDGLGAVTVEDPHGSWGEGVAEPNPILLNDVRHLWRIEQTQVLETGPIRSALWVRLSGGHSTLDLTFSLTAGRDAVDVAARLLWDERSARLRLTMPIADAFEATYSMPGELPKRGDEGEVPGGRFVRVHLPNGQFGFATDSLSSYSLQNFTFGATVARASRYADDNTAQADSDIHNPAVDRGELKFKCLLTSTGEDIENLADELCEPAIVQIVPAVSGDLPKTGSLGSLEPAGVKLLALKPTENKGEGIVVRVHNSGLTDQEVTFMLGQERIRLGKAGAGKIVSWQITADAGGFRASAVDNLG